MKSQAEQMDVLVFVHGWPDGPEVWSRQFEFFKSRFHCHLITLPGFSETDLEKDIHMDFPELVEFVAKEVRQFKKPVTIIGHDWGASISYMCADRYPELVERIIGLDVGGTGPSKNPVNIALIVMYQFWLAGAWMLRKKSPALARVMTSSFMKLIKAPYTSSLSVSKNYVYYYCWRDIFLSRYRKQFAKKFKPHCPVLYISGSKKPMTFHNRKWKKLLQRRPDSKFVEIENAGHWFMLDNPAMTNSVMNDWLQKVSP